MYFQYFLRKKKNSTSPPTLEWEVNIRVHVKHGENGHPSEECRGLSHKSPRLFVCETKGNRTPGRKTTRHGRTKVPHHEGHPISWLLGRHGKPGRSWHDDTGSPTCDPLQSPPKTLQQYTPDTKGPFLHQDTNTRECCRGMTSVYPQFPHSLSHVQGIDHVTGVPQRSSDAYDQSP